MKLSIYKTLKQLFDAAINRKTKGLEELEDRYLNDAGDYNKGEEVDLYKFGKRCGRGVVTGNEFVDDKKIDTQPVIHRLDKDGNKRKARWWSWYNYDEIKKIN